MKKGAVFTEEHKLKLSLAAKARVRKPYRFQEERVLIRQ